jgi:hypothetical protein
MKGTTKPRVDLDRPLLSLSGSNHPDDDFTLRHLFENVFISGSTGSGKSSGSGSAIASALLDARGLLPEEYIGLIVFIYKQSDVEDWLRMAFQAGRQDDVIHIQSHHANVFNILEQYKDQEPMNAVNALLNVSGLMAESGKGEEEFWQLQKSKALDRLIRLNKICGQPLSIETLYHLHNSAPVDSEQVKSKEFREQSFCWNMLAMSIEKVGENHPDFKMVYNYFVREMPFLDDRTASNIRTMVGGILEPFISSSILKQMFCGSSKLQLDDVFTGKIVLLDIPVQTHEYVGKIAQIMFKYAFQKAVEKRNLETHPNPVIFHQDEAQQFLTRFDHSFMSTCRASRAGSILLSQNISNYHAAITGDRAEAKVNSLLALCNTKIFHAQNDHLTNEYASKTIGMGVQNLSSFSSGKDNIGSASISQHIQYQVQPTLFTMLRTGGIRNNYLVDAIITGTGRIFSSQTNFLQTAFQQPFAH